MAAEEPTWRQDLARDLKEIAGRYTRDRYEASQETRRDYEQTLNMLETRYQDRLDLEDRKERQLFDRDYRQQGLDRLNEQERATWPTVRTGDGLYAIRAGQRGERADLSGDRTDPDYRRSQGYQDGMRELVERQTAQRERLDQAFRTVEEGLNERFGFTRARDPQERER